MIPVNIDDIDVLRRTLEDMDSRIPSVVTVNTVVELKSDADLLTTVAKLNEVIKSFNKLVGQLEVRK